MLSCLLLLISNWGSSVNAQRQFKIYSVNEGLANSTVHHLMQDQNGYLWFATDAGINRFDGNNFETFTMDDGLGDNTIYEIKEDSQGRIWFMPYNGQLSYYKEEIFYNESNAPVFNQIEYNSSVFSFLEDNDQNLWFVYSNKGLVKLDEDGVSHIDIPGTIHSIWKTSDGINAFASFAMVEIKGKDINYQEINYGTSAHKKPIAYLGNGEILYSCKSGLCIMKETDTANARVLITSEDLGTRDLISALKVDQLGNLWVGTQGGGIFWFEDFMNQSAKPPVRYLEGEYITSILEDREGNFWFSTHGNGVFFLADYHDDFERNLLTRTLSDQPVHSVFEDSQGKVWAGMQNSDIYIYDGDSIYNHTIDKGYKGIDRIVDIFEHENGRVWTAFDQGLYIWENDTLADYEIKWPKGSIFGYMSFEMTEDELYDFIKIEPIKKMVYNRSDNTVWLADKRHIVQVIETLGKVTPYQIQLYGVGLDSETMCVLPGKDEFWYGTNTSFYRFSSKDSSFHDYGAEFPALRQRITDIKELDDGTFWISTHGNGLVHFDGEKPIEQLTKEDGLISNICKKLLVDDYQQLWVVTNKGLNKISWQNGKRRFFSYSAVNGLLANEINDVFVKKNKVYAATTKGLSIFNAEKLDSIASAPPVYFKKLEAKDTIIIDPSNVELNHAQNQLTIHFTAPVFQHNEAVSFQYKLSDDDDWSTTEQRSVSYEKLQPGIYNLELRAKHYNSEWSKAETLKFTIQPAWWQKLWVRILALALLAALIGYFVTRRIRAVNRKSRLQAKVSELESRLLRSQMNPHFVFNSMNIIQYYIATSEEDMALMYIEDFATLMRMILENSKKPSISIAQELKYLELYLQLEGRRFSGKFDFKINVADDVDINTYHMPPMLIQPFAENAIKHGLMPKRDKGSLRIDISKENKKLKCVIEDDGIGIDVSLNNKKMDGKHKSSAMLMTRERLSLLDDNLAQLEIKNLYDETVEPKRSLGTRITLYLPLETATVQADKEANDLNQLRNSLKN